MTALIRSGVARMPARAHRGMWIVDCPRCANAMRWPVGTPSFDCDECDQPIEIVWPPQEMVEAVERLLMMRPVPHTRNWNPGETLHDLMFENGAHGIYDQLEPTTPGRVLLSVTDGAIEHDALPAATERKALA